MKQTNHGKQGTGRNISDQLKLTTLIAFIDRSRKKQINDKKLKGFNCCFVEK